MALDSLLSATEEKCDFYLSWDVDTFITSDTLKSMVNLNLEIVAPMLRLPDGFYENYKYSNFHYHCLQNGYFDLKDYAYNDIFDRKHIGIINVDVVHICYLIRADVIPYLTYLDDTIRNEYVIFSESARKNGIQQYLDNRKEYGLITYEPGVLVRRHYPQVIKTFDRYSQF